MRRFVSVFGATLVVFSAWAHADSGTPVGQEPVIRQPPNEARTLSVLDAEALAEFNKRVTEYAEMHRRLEATLPKLPKETTSQVIDTHQRALEKLIQAERRKAQPGNIFTQPVRRGFRRVFARVFSGAEGRDLKATILDENPGRIRIAVNSRYPDSVPLSTVPPQLLSSLPTLPEEIEYRFLGERLVLLDVHAHTIIDFMDDVFPA